MYVKYKHGEKVLFTFSTVKYWVGCVYCGEMTTRKLLTSKGVIAKELYKSYVQNPSGRDYRAGFFCSEECIKKAIFNNLLKGGIKIRKRLEPWLNQAPQEYIKRFGGKTFYNRNHGEVEGGPKTFHENFIRVLKNQDGNVNYVEFYGRGSPIQFFTATANITEVLNAISQLINVEEKTCVTTFSQNSEQTSPQP